MSPNLTNRNFLATLLLVGGLTSGCAEPFDPPSLIERTRVLGARVEVAGDASRATPAPGEIATVTWIMAAPAALPALGWAFVLCPVATTSADPCSPAPLAIFQGTGAPAFDLAIPPAAELGGAQRLQVLGQICDGAAPSIDPQTGRPVCPGPGTFATVDLSLQVAGQVNHNPALDQRQLWWDGVLWPAGDALDCASLPTVAAGSKDHVLRIQTLAEDRETFVAMLGDPPVPTTTREVLQISHFGTDGELGQSMSIIEASDQQAETFVEAKWEAPEVPPADGRVRFTFVARDLRGGVGYASRTACVQ